MYGSKPKASGARIPMLSQQPQSSSLNIHMSAWILGSDLVADTAFF